MLQPFPYYSIHNWPEYLIWSQSVTTKSDVEDFNPHTLNCGVHQAGLGLRELLLTKLINAEQSCYRSSVFLNLEQRTRFTMLNDVSTTLIDETNKYLNRRKSTNSSSEDNSLNVKEKGLLTNMKNLLGKKSKSKSFLNSTQSLVGKSGYAMLGPLQPPLPYSLSLSRGTLSLSSI